jgi:vacuolar protein 8
MLIFTVGQYKIFIQHWEEPMGGIHGYLKRFLNSGDATFQHIAIWTLMQLLESNDKDLTELISKSKEVVDVVQSIAERSIDSDDEDNDEGEGEVIGLARKCLELLGKSPKTLVEG